MELEPAVARYSLDSVSPDLRSLKRRPGTYHGSVRGNKQLSRLVVKRKAVVHGHRLMMDGRISGYSGSDTGMRRTRVCVV